LSVRCIALLKNADDYVHDLNNSVQLRPSAGAPVLGHEHVQNLAGQNRFRSEAFQVPELLSRKRPLKKISRQSSIMDRPHRASVKVIDIKQRHPAFLKETQYLVAAVLRHPA
jgi:hypothetical protein